MTMEPTQFPPAAPRKMLHQRSVRCDGYLRADGQWEVEASLRDTKCIDFVQITRGPQKAGAAVHDMKLRVTVDDQLTITAIESEMATTPMLACQDAREYLHELIGVRFVSGWQKEARARIGHRHACTHLMDLLVPAATTFYQTMGWGKNPEGGGELDHVRASGDRPGFLDRCYGWRTDGPGVSEHFPQFADKSVDERSEP
ncbi:DUF2889 domain-containing protein [Sphingobium sp. BS19]|uniref:DUF2889 domain-containing protein n=1 Tax=Sphingobium sp. BS19 TaxID=3018973 RepID=UPI002491C2CD|nr:DUF2889 domain-containing protein [Sphingobium sp. BS19]